MCGICGVFNHKEASRIVYLCLYSLQHRGQESCGIVASDGKNIKKHINMGLVSEVFNKEILNKLKGSLSIGHTRYSTSGGSILQNAQPIVVNTYLSPIAVAHNGNLTNAVFLRNQLEKEGSIFQTDSDSEIILHIIAKKICKENSIVSVLKSVFSEIKGAYSLVLSTKTQLIAVRDPWGVRPLVLGKLKNSFIVASETCAFDLVDAKYIRDIRPGEILIIDKDGLKSVNFSSQKQHAYCIFEFIYFARPDSKIFGRSVYTIRKELGKQLAKESPVKADLVIAVPDSANVAAVGYSQQTKIPLGIGFIRSHYVGRTFIEPSQSIRDFGAKLKYNAISDSIKNKDIVLVDDSIVRGTTSKKLIRMLKKAGARRVHLRISSPPIISSCYYGIDTPTKEELIAANYSIGEIKKYLKVDSLSYLSIEGMLKATKMNPDDFCIACFNQNYKISLVDQLH